MRAVTQSIGASWMRFLDFAVFHHLEMGINDVNGQDIPLNFYNDRRDSELEPSQARKGYTVAIPYVKRHVFVCGNPGVRLEDIGSQGKQDCLNSIIIGLSRVR
jgi:hypothetical protein